MYGQSFVLGPRELSADFVLPIGKAKIMREGCAWQPDFSVSLCLSVSHSLTHSLTLICDHQISLCLSHSLSFCGSLAISQCASDLLLLSGTDVTIVSFSRMVGESLKAAEKLKEKGISAEVLLCCAVLCCAVLYHTRFVLLVHVQQRAYVEMHVRQEKWV